MSCKSCKEKSSRDINKIISRGEKPTIGVKIRNYFFNFLLFLLLTVIVVPIAIPGLIYLLFKSIVLEKRINIYPMLLFIAKKIVTKYGEDDEDDEDEDNNGEYDDDDEYDDEEYEYELENPNDVIEIKNK